MPRHSSVFLPPIFAFVFIVMLLTLFETYSATKGNASLVSLQKHFQTLTPDKPEYRTFYNNYQSFYREGKEEQQERLRQIQKDLESDPQSQILQRTLATYHAWRKTVPDEKNKIDQAKTIEERLEVIHTIKKNQDRIQGISEQKKLKSHSKTLNLYPTISELAEYLQYLDAEDPARLETLLGHTPDRFLYRLEQDYRAEAE